jgi:hypothetical protein
MMQCSEYANKKKKMTSVGREVITHPIFHFVLSGNIIDQKVLPFLHYKKDSYLLNEMVLKMGKLVCVYEQQFLFCAAHEVMI